LDKEMNLFVLDHDHQKNAEYHVDKHVVKMPLEAAQVLCTTHWISEIIGSAPRPLNSNELKELRAASRVNTTGIPYKPTHPNHPCVVWTRTNIKNFDWVLGYLFALGDEYTHRYGKYHKSVEQVSLLGFPSKIPPAEELSPFALAMPDKYKNDDPVQAYRDYYVGDKSHIASWKTREVPKWFFQQLKEL